MKLLYITNGISGAGGLERVLSVKASYFADVLGYEVHIVTLNDGDNPLFYTFSSKIHLQDVSVKGNPLVYAWSYVRGIQKAVRAIQPDVILVCDDGLKGFFLPVLLRKPCAMVYERHASINLNFNIGKINIIKKSFDILVYVLMKFCARFFDKFIVLTNGNKKEWVSNNLEVIPNPLSFYPMKKANLKSKKIIAVGSHSYNKGYDLLLHSWKEVFVKHPDWVLEIYGKIDENKKYIKLATELGLNSSVMFFEPNADIENKYLQSSIMVLSSRSEGFGMVLIEAMACGLPCVSFDCPSGPADIIVNDYDGFLIQNGNILLFAEKILKLIEDLDLRINIGKNARESVTRYLPKEITSQWDKLFKELIK